MKASDILGFSDLRTKVVPVPQWDCELTVQELGLGDGLRLIELIGDVDDDGAIEAVSIAQVVALGVIDENGNRLFGDDDVEALAQKNSKALMILYSEITGLSGEEAEKN